MLKLNFLELTREVRKAGFREAFRKAGILGFGNSGFSRRRPGEGADGGVHVHHDVEEMYVTMDGKAVATVNGQRVPLAFGDILIIQPGEAHKIEADSDSEHGNLWIEPAAMRFLTPLPEGRRYLFRNLADCPKVPCPCGESTRVVTKADTPAANIHITRITDSRRHYHKRCMEYYHVLEGSGRLEVGGETVEMSPGVTVVIPPGLPHRAYGELKILIVGVPALEEDDEYFDEPG